MVADIYKECIVSYIDLIDLKKTINNPNHAVEIMGQVHQTVYSQISNDMPLHSYAYSWNDSVLLLAYINNRSSDFNGIIKEVVDLKRKIDQVRSCYTICMKGLVFPSPFQYAGAVYDSPQPEQPRHVFIKASSIAFANCIEIEKCLGKFRKAWYIDESIAKELNSSNPCLHKKIKLLPNNEEKIIYMFDVDPL